ncbi:hypothetical protein [Roseivivax marinus]|uniref:hypothetical protein n=1 Tax=Roseivivax marinus TaxID=1379903 RepID=UPI00273F8334|nr:hypothetical protein [Roseivivax marinus]
MTGRGGHLPGRSDSAARLQGRGGAMGQGKAGQTAPATPRIGARDDQDTGLAATETAMTEARHGATQDKPEDV